MQLVLTQGIFFGAFFALVLSMMHLARTGKRMLNTIMGLLALSVAVLFFFLYLDIANLHPQPDAFRHIYLPCIYWLGPGMYLLFMATIDEDYMPRLDLLHLLPGGLIALAVPISFWIAPELHARQPLAYLKGESMDLWSWLQAAGFAINPAYYVLSMVRARALFRLQSLKGDSSARMLLWILCSSMAFSLALFAAYPFQSILMLYGTAFATMVMTVLSFVAGQRTPDLFNEMEAAVRKAYRNSRLEGVDLQQLQKRLKQAMEEEAYYLTDSLSLNDLAEHLDIKAYQLSEYLNQHKLMNFSRFVNGYRVEAAARILLEEEAANILSVAFKVGFNSKANFNLAFKSIKGCSPREFLHRARESKAKPGKRKNQKRRKARTA